MLLPQAHPRVCTQVLRRQIYALRPTYSNRCARTSGWDWAGPSRIESVRWTHQRSQDVHQKPRRVEGMRKKPPPPSILSPSLQALSRYEVTSNLVATPRHVSDMLQTISRMPSSPPEDSALYLDLQAVDLSRNGDISVMALFVAHKRHVYLIDVQELGEEAFTTSGSGTSLKRILESADIPKVFFDVRDDASALFGLFGIRLQGVEDVQLWENAARGKYTRHYLHSLSRCMELDAAVEESQREAWLETKEKGLALFSPKEGQGGSFTLFKERPLLQVCRDYCVHQVKWLPIIRSWYKRELGTRMNWRLRVALESRKRVQASESASYVSNDGDSLRGPWGGKHPGILRQERQQKLGAEKEQKQGDSIAQTKGGDTAESEASIVKGWCD